MKALRCFTQKEGLHPFPLSACWPALQWAQVWPDVLQSPGQSFPLAVSSFPGSSSAWQFQESFKVKKTNKNISPKLLAMIVVTFYRSKKKASTCKTLLVLSRQAPSQCRWEYDQYGEWSLKLVIRIISPKVFFSFKLAAWQNQVALPCSMAFTRRLVILIASSRVTKEVYSIEMRIMVNMAWAINLNIKKDMNSKLSH